MSAVRSGITSAARPRPSIRSARSSAAAVGSPQVTGGSRGLLKLSAVKSSRFQPQHVSAARRDEHAGGCAPSLLLAPVRLGPVRIEDAAEPGDAGVDTPLD